MDERRRRLEREAPGDELARARLLRERMRAGELREDRVLLAATARLPEAQLALGWTDLRRYEPAIDHVDDLANWVRDLSALAPEAGPRAAVAASWRAIRYHDAWARGEELREAIAFVRGVQRWLDHDPWPAADDSLIPRPRLGVHLTFWRMLAISARQWAGLSAGRNPPEKIPSGARTVIKVGEFLTPALPDPVTPLRLAITSAIGKWALDPRPR
jgi:hypothetical protein